MGSDDARLIERAQKGDSEALVAIYERYQPSIFNYLFFRVNDQATAEDLTAEVFVRMVDKMDGFTDRGRPVLAWLYTIARNLLIDHHRKNSRQMVEFEDGMEEEPEENFTHTVEQRLVLEAVRSAMQHLTDEQRQVILLRFLEGLSNAEISARIGKPEGAIKALQHRGLHALRRVLEKEQPYEY